MRFKADQRVILKANKKEGWAEERGKMLEDVPDNLGCAVAQYMTVVQIDDQYKRGKRDDGLREVSLDQVKAEKMR